MAEVGALRVDRALEAVGPLVDALQGLDLIAHDLPEILRLTRDLVGHLAQFDVFLAQPLGRLAGLLGGPDHLLGARPQDPTQFLAGGERLLGRLAQLVDRLGQAVEGGGGGRARLLAHRLEGFDLGPDGHARGGQEIVDPFARRRDLVRLRAQGVADLLGLRGGAHAGAGQLLRLLPEGVAQGLQAPEDVVRSLGQRARLLLEGIGDRRDPPCAALGRIGHRLQAGEQRPGLLADREAAHQIEEQQPDEGKRRRGARNQKRELVGRRGLQALPTDEALDVARAGAQPEQRQQPTDDQGHHACEPGFPHGVSRFPARLKPRRAAGARSGRSRGRRREWRFPARRSPRPRRSKGSRNPAAG